MTTFNETQQFTIDAKKLADRGWEFDDQNGYRFFQDKQFNYTDEELEDYESFVEASEVNLIVRDDEALYLINRKGTDWSQADAHVDAGDLDMIAGDLQDLGLIKKTYKIEAGTIVTEYEGATEEEALEAYAKDAGYNSYEDLVDQHGEVDAIEKA